MNDDLYFFADGKHFLWPSERDGYMHLYRYRMDGTLVNQVTKGKWALASAGGIAFWVHQALVGVDEKNDWIYFTALERSSIERHLYRISQRRIRVRADLEGRGHAPHFDVTRRSVFSRQVFFHRCSS
jgi:dipeptidyl-peptidase-4